MVNYIYSVIGEEKVSQILRKESFINFSEQIGKDLPGKYYFSAKYIDNGTPKTESLIGSEVITFKSACLDGIQFDEKLNFFMWGTKPSMAQPLEKTGYFMYKNIDLKCIKSIELQYASKVENLGFDIVLDSLKGKKIGYLGISKTKDFFEWKFSKSELPKIDSIHNLYFVINNPGKTYLNRQIRLRSILFNHINSKVNLENKVPTLPLKYK